MPQNIYKPNFNSSPAPIERIIGALTYINCLIGLVWLIIAALTKKGLRPFLQYHIYQSLFLAFALFIISSGLGLLMQLVNFIPFINNVVSMITFYLNTPILLGFSAVSFIIFSIVIYLALGALLGRYSYFPWVSDIIKGNIRG